jgi:predicted Zn-dependent protease
LKVVDDREFNTFSLPGGFLSFSVGLIPDSENEVQQTAALAHETAHVTACQMTRVEMRSKIDRRRAFAARPLRSVTRRWFGPLLLAELVRNAEFDADQLVGGAFRIPTNGSGKADFLHAFLDQHRPAKTRTRATEIISFLRVRRITFVDTNEFHETKERLATEMALDEIPKFRRQRRAA